jgi:hypothetical protein
MCCPTNQEVFGPCVGLGMELFVCRVCVVPVEEAFVRPKKSGVCAPGRMSPREEKVYVHRGAYVAQRRRGVCASRGVSPGEEEAYVRRGACVTQRRRRLCAVRRMKLRREYGKPASRRTQGLGRECEK